MVLSEENRRYLSGFRGHDTQFDESAGALFISEAGLILATDSRYEEQASKEAPLYEIVCCKEGIAKQIPSIINMLGAKRLGFESVRISYLEYMKMSEEIKSSDIKVDLTETENIVETFRAIKDENEIKSIRKALSIAESAYIRILDSIRPGITEKEAAWLIEKASGKQAQRVSLFLSSWHQDQTAPFLTQSLLIVHLRKENRFFLTGAPG